MTTIEWVDGGDTWNPIRARNKETGGVGHFCIHASDGCKNCYSEKYQPRQKNHVRFAAQDASKVDVYLDDTVLARPISWQRGRKIFPCSMTDMFGEFVKEEWLDRIFAVMTSLPRHTFKVLTKRAERMMRYAQDWERRSAAPLPANIWLGVSVEDQKNAEARIPLLLQTPTAVRWISAEPLLGPVDLQQKLKNGDRVDWLKGMVYPNAPIGNDPPYALDRKLDWVVVGGESGPGAREFNIGWADSLIAQCKATGTPIFVKQLGARPVVDDYQFVIHLKDKKGGNEAEWPARLRVREFPC